MPINPLDNSSSTGNTDDQNLQDQQKTQISGGAGANIGGGGSAGGVAPAQKPSSSGFTNVNQYVEANKDQSAGLGNKIAQGVEQTASQGLQGLSQAQQEFNQQQQAAGVNPSDYSLSNVSQKVQKDISASQNTPQDEGIQSDIQQFQNVQAKNTALQGGSDTAAKTLSATQSYAPASEKLSEAQQAAGLTGTESGRAQLLRGGTIQSTDPNNPNAQVQITGGFQRPSYTTGQVNLDQLLTQNAPQNATALSTLRNSLLGQYGLANQEAQAVQNAAQTRQGVIQGTNQAEQNIQNVLMGQTDANGNPVAAPAGVQTGVLTNLYSQLQAAPTTLNQQQAQTLASNKQALTQYLTNLYGSNIGGTPISTLVDSMVTPNSTLGSANIVNTMTPQQLNELQTLNQLAGQTGTNINTLGTGTNATVIDPTQVGTNAFNAGVTQNMTPASQAVQQVVNDEVTKVNSAFANLQNNTQPTIATPQGNKTFSDAVNSAKNAFMNGFSTPGNFQRGDAPYTPASYLDKYQTDNIKYGNQVQLSILNNINNIRQQNGLDPIPAPATPIYDNNHKNDVAAYTNNLNSLIQSNLSISPAGVTNVPQINPTRKIGPGPQVRG